MIQNIMLYTTKNLAIRRLVKEDAATLVELSKAEGCPNFPNECFTSLEEADAFVEHQQRHYQKGHFPLRFAIILKKENRLIGTVSLKLNEKREIKVTMMLFDAYRNCGYATETMEATVEYVKKQYKVEQVFAYSRSSAVIAQKLLKKVGFAPESEFEDDFFGQKVTFIRFVK